jgi:hypothetical protein
LARVVCMYSKVITVCGLGGGAESGTSCVYTSSHRSRTKRQFLCLEAKISLGGLVGWLQNPSPNPISKLVVITHQSRDAAAVYCSSVMERAQPRRKRPLLAPTLPLCEWAPADHEMMTDCRRSGRLRDQVQRKCWVRQSAGLADPPLGDRHNHLAAWHARVIGAICVIQA